ncbi:MAG TPA: glycoside hydrolase family 65 protein, partial [Phycisphaerae bacterium]|nr:glycoside hydrolase family 65 protein [Phycisphaerae bacterium]
MSNDWSIIESPFHVETAKAYEGLFTLGSGYLHVRGSLEEHLAGAPQNVSYTRLPANVTSERFADTKSKWGTYVPGVFGRHPLLNNEMINLPFFLGLAPIVDDERLDMESAQITGYRRELRLDTATLIRT